VCFFGGYTGKTPTRRNLGEASLFSFIMVAKVKSIDAFRTQANSSGMIEDEKLFNGCFENGIVWQWSIWYARSGKKLEYVSPCPSGNGPAAGEWSGKKPAFCLKLTAPREKGTDYAVECACSGQ
jgi:hypothetical protein